MSTKKSRNTQTEKENLDFNTTRVKRIEDIQQLYSDEYSTDRRFNRNRSQSSARVQIKTAAELRDLLMKAAVQSSTDNNAARTELTKLSRNYYATNPIYKAGIDYLVNMFKWDYKVIPHKIYTESKAAGKKKLKTDDYIHMYNLMLELAEGLAFPVKGPSILENLFLDGAVYFTTLNDKDSYTIDTLILPSTYCKKIGDTQFGTNIVAFNMSYFDTLGLKAEEINDYFEAFPEEFKLGYLKYKSDSKCRWIQLDPRFSSCILLNDQALPTYAYIIGGILDFEKYSDNELERNENALKYLVVHTIPHYEDDLIFEVDEVAAMHRSLKKIVDTGEKARLITSYGDIHVEQISENDTSENQVLSKAFKAIFNNAGLNSGIFTSETVEALKMSLIRDQGIVWRYIQKLVNFYNLAVNSWFDFKGYQADIDILKISSYTYNDDIKVYKDNATLGVNKIDYLIASGIHQKHISDTLDLEKYLGLENITPMQTSYTQTAEDREAEKSSATSDTSKDSKTEIEPSDNKKSEE